MFVASGAILREVTKWKDFPNPICTHDSSLEWVNREAANSPSILSADLLGSQERLLAYQSLSSRAARPRTNLREWTLWHSTRTH